LYVDTLREYGEHYLLADRVGMWVGGNFKADSISLISKGACTVVEDIALHFEKSVEMFQKRC